MSGAALALLGSCFAPSAPPPTQAAGLDKRQLGQLAFIRRLALQLPGDWSHMGAEEPGQGGFDAYRYQLAMMSYALAIAQHHYTPAWRNGHRETSRRLIDKMLRFDVWSCWELTSRGARVTEPGLVVLRPGSIDAVAF